MISEKISSKSALCSTKPENRTRNIIVILHLMQGSPNYNQESDMALENSSFGPRQSLRK